MPCVTPRPPALLALALLLAAACESSTPTIPLPPPNALVEAPPDADGYVTVRIRGAEPEALLFAYDEPLAKGVIGRADADGNGTLRLRAAAGDPILVWQQAGDRSSAPVTVLVPSPDGGGG